MTVSPKAGFPLMPSNIFKNEDLYNQFVVLQEALLYGSVIDRDIADPSASPVISPTNGDTYIVASGGAGDWSGQDDNIAVYYNGWKFIPAIAGATIWVIDEGVRIQFRAGAWVTVPDNAIVVEEWTDPDYDEGVAKLNLLGAGYAMVTAGSVASITIDGGPPPVQALTISDPSGSPVVVPSFGEKWIVAATGAGDWAGQDNNIAVWADDGSSPGGEWKFITAADGMSVVDLVSGNFYIYSAGSPVGWSVVSSSGLSDGDFGDITVSGGGTVMTIDADAVTFAKIQNIATAKMLGRNTAGSGDIEEIDRVSSGERTAGTGTALRGFTPADIASMAGTHGGSGGSLAGLSDVDLTGSPAPTLDDILFYDTSTSPPAWRFKAPATGQGFESYCELSLLVASHANSTIKIMTWAEVDDTDDYFDSGSSTEEINAPFTGRYRLTCGLHWASLAAAWVSSTVVRLNRSGTSFDDDFPGLRDDKTEPSATTRRHVWFGGIITLTAGDTIDIAAFHTSATRDTDSGGRLWLEYLGP